MKKEVKKQTANAVLEITDLKQLQALCDAPLHCEFSLDGQVIRVPLRRLTAAIEEQRRDILRSVPPPPYVKERGEYDALNPAYVKAKEVAEKKARSLVVYACCPMVAAQKPGLTAVDDIHRFVQGLLAENLLDVMALTAMASGLSVEVNRRANFTSPPDSES
jgi:hypothetical protein